MRPVVEFCASNAFHGTDEMIRKLQADSSIDVKEYGCLGNCGECYMSPYALVNGESVVAQTAEGLYAQILEKVNEIKAIHDL
jgi:uncharacterized protein YuzB (UPF0349 family)